MGYVFSTPAGLVTLFALGIEAAIALINHRELESGRIAALLTIYTGWDYFNAGIRYLVEEDERALASVRASDDAASLGALVQGAGLVMTAGPATSDTPATPDALNAAALGMTVQVSCWAE